MNKSNLQKLFKSQLIDLLLTKVIHNQFPNQEL